MLFFSLLWSFWCFLLRLLLFRYLFSASFLSFIWSFFHLRLISSDIWYWCFLPHFRYFQIIFFFHLLWGWFFIDFSALMIFLFRIFPSRCHFRWRYLSGWVHWMNEAFSRFLLLSWFAESCIESSLLFFISRCFFFLFSMISSFRFLRYFFSLVSSIIFFYFLFIILHFFDDHLWESFIIFFSHLSYFSRVSSVLYSFSYFFYLFISRAFFMALYERQKAASSDISRFISSSICFSFFFWYFRDDLFVIFRLRSSIFIDCRFFDFRRD